MPCCWTTIIEVIMYYSTSLGGTRRLFKDTETKIVSPEMIVSLDNASDAIIEFVRKILTWVELIHALHVRNTMCSLSVIFLILS